MIKSYDFMRRCPSLDSSRNAYRKKDRLVIKLVLIFGLWLITSQAVFAQVGLSHAHPNLARGSGPDKTMERYDWDSINLFNGNLSVSIPLGIEYPITENFSYGFKLNYNSNIWDLDQPSGAVVATPVKNSNAGLGWDLSFGRLLAPYANGFQTGKWVYVSPDGTMHLFYSTLHHDLTESDPQDIYMYTRDGSYYRMHAYSSTQRFVEAPDGTQSLFQLINGEWKLTQIGDRFNNQLRFTYSTSNTCVISDNHGRTHTIYFKSDPAGAYPALVERVVLAAFNGTTATYTFSYSTAAVSRPNVDNDPTTSATLNLSVLTGVAAPDGSQHTFTYKPTSAPASSSGRLASMQLPTMGKIEWSYDTYSFTDVGNSSALAPLFRQNTGVSTRRLVDLSGGAVGAWTYTPALKPGTRALASSDQVWGEDSLPAGAVSVGEWNWVSSSPAPFSGTLAHRSGVATGLHQHYFYNATTTLPVNAGDVLVAYVFLDPANPPKMVMLQWNDGNWEHRAYWGANHSPWGVDGTESRRYMGPLPAVGQWVRLEVPAGQVGLAGSTLNGLAFTLYDGRATWDHAGKNVGTLLVDQELCNTVRTPLKDKTSHYFSVNTQSTGTGWSRSEYALPFTKNHADETGTRYLSSQIYDCDADGNNCQLLRSKYVRYEQDAATDPASPEVEAVNRREASQRNVYHDDVDNGVQRFADIDSSDFDGVGHYRRTVTNGNFGGGDIREVFIDYNASTGTYPSPGFTPPGPAAAWILNTLSKRKVTEGQSSLVTEYCYDRNNGFLKRERRWTSTVLNSNASSTDVLINYIPDASGNTVIGQYFGGDLQPLGTGSLCSLPLPGSDQYQIRHAYNYGVRSGSSHHTSSGGQFGPKFLDRDIDRNTGLVSATRDTAGIRTSYEYDAMGRQVWMKPEAGHGAWRHFNYTPATAADYAKKFIYDKTNGTGNVLTYNVDVYDSFGQLWWEQTAVPGSYPSRYTYRNAMGWITHKSGFSLDAPKFSEYLDYDPLGRPRTVRPPEGAQHDTAFEYKGIRSIKTTRKIATSYNTTTGAITEEPKATTEVYDRQGRLWKKIGHTVDRFGTQRDITTVNTYDIHGNLTSMVEDGRQLSGASTYDGRGFLKSETSTDAGGRTISYLDIDPFGRARRTQRQSHVSGSVVSLAYSYDRAARLTRINDHLDPSKVLKEYFFADSNEPNNWKAGKLSKAVRYNDMSRFLAPFGINVVAVTETYSYGAVGGRLSEYVTELSDSSGRYEKFIQSQTYTETGEIASIGYPKAASNSSVTINRDRTVANSYAVGKLISIGGTYNSQAESWASSINYHTNGMISQVVRGNGVTDNYAKDQHNYLRPESVSTSGARLSPSNSPADLNVSPYVYDGGGNLARAGDKYLVRPSTYQQPDPSEPVAYSIDPCSTGWRDQLDMITALNDYQCRGRVFFFYTASDRLYKIENPERGEEGRTWYLYDAQGTLLTEHKTAFGFYQIWPGTWEYTRDYIYSGTSLLATDEINRQFPRQIIHYHSGAGVEGIRTDGQGYRK